MAVLGHLAKLKRGLGLAFGAKCSVFNILAVDKVQCQEALFLSQYITQDVLLSSYLDS